MQYFGTIKTVKNDLHRSAIIFIALFLFSAFTTNKVFANTYTPNTFADPVITTVNNATGEINGGSTISLRSALMAADNLGGTHTITLSSGTYLVSQALPNRQITFGNTAQDITITGNGPANTIIDMVADADKDRIFLINPTGTVTDIYTTISGIAFTNGYSSSDNYGGAAIYAGGSGIQSLTITNCLFEGNTVPLSSGGQGGAINMLQGTLTIDNSSFINNSSFESDGGAIYYLLLNSDPADDGAVSITNSIFTGNTATGNGGAISFITQPSLPAGQTFSLGISKNTFLTNTATGYGGAISANNAAAASTPSINYNRFVGNTSTALANTGGLNFIHSDGSVNAENNWWGCNFGPTASPCDKAGSTGSPGSGSLDADPWLQLKVTASPNPICNTNAGAGNTTTVTASFLSNSDDAPVAAANLSAFVGLPVTWSSSLGTLGAPQELTIQADGEAINTFTSDGTTGNASAGAKVDNIPPTDSDSRVTIVVNASSTAPTGATGTTTICTGSSTTLTVDGGSKGTGATTEWFTGTCGGTAAGTGDAITVSPAVTTTYYVRYTGTCNTTTCAEVTVTINPSSTAPTGVTGTTTICNGGSTTLTVDGGSKAAGSVTQWFTGSCGGSSAGTGDAITVSPSATTTYYVRYSGACNTTTCAEVTVTVNTPSTAPTGVTGTSTICNGESTTLTVAGGSKGTGAITEWFTGSCGGTAAGTGDAITVSPTATTTYYVRYNGVCNATSCATVTVTVNTESTAPTGATGSTTICNGSSTTLTVAGGIKGTGAITQWFTGSCGGTSAGTGDAITVSPGTTTTYYVRYSGTCNTTSCATVTVTVSALSAAPTGATGTKTICSGSSTTLTVAGGLKGAGAVTQWFTGSCGGTAIGTGDAITVSPVATTTYYVRYSGGCNTTACAAVTVTVHNSVIATCSTNNSSLYYGYAGDQTATIKAIASGGTAPYTVSITMNRPLNCNVITSAGDELWAGVGGSSFNNVCPAAGPGLTPVSTGTVAASGGFYAVNVTLMQDAVFTATITDANGCIATCTVSVRAADARCFAGNSGNAKVKICHKTGNGCHAICVSASAVAAHLAHGDFIGECAANCEAPYYARGAVVAGKEEAFTDEKEEFNIAAYPNPSSTEFTLQVKGTATAPVTVKVLDVNGVVRSTTVMSPKSNTIKLGNELKAGTYMVEVIQGTERKVLKLLKLN